MGKQELCNQVIAPELYDFIKIIISVLTGMFGKSLIEYFQNKKNIKKEKKFILQYLKNARKIFPIIVEDYLKLKEFVPALDNSLLEINKFEEFDTEILKSISFKRYYEIFGDKSNVLFEIYHMVESIREDLPIPLHANYLDSVKDLDIESEGKDNIKFQQRLQILKTTIDLKIKEINILEEKINFLESK